MSTHDALSYDPYRLLAVMVVVMLLIFLAVIVALRRRGERVERKVDLIAARLGLRAEVEGLDRESGRRSNMAPLAAELPAAPWGTEGGAPRAWPGNDAPHRPPPAPPRPR